MTSANAQQEALLWQRDRATGLSVEILQLRYKTSYLKTRVPGLSSGIICVIPRLAVFTQFRSVTDAMLVAVHAVVVCLSVRLQIMPHDRPETLVFKWDVLYRSCRISTDKPVARSLCHSRASC